MAAAIVASLWVAALHVMYMFSAGPLWRDEAGSIGFASMPSLAAIWRNLQYDNFPPLFVLVARAWALGGGTSDLSYRFLGALIGLATLAVLWFASRQLGARVPLLVLALYASNPLAVRVGDAMRPYGLGIAMTLLALACVWNLARREGSRPVLWAAVAAVLSVQCLYQSAFFLVAFCAGAWAVTLRRRDWQASGQIAFAGVAAALSLLPHAANIRKSQEWFGISRLTIHLDAIGRPLMDALDSQGRCMTAVWLGLLPAALAAAVILGWRRRESPFLFCGTTMAASVVLYLLFVRAAGLQPRPWYFLLLMAPVALGVDAVFGGMEMPWARMARTALTVVLALACAAACCKGVRLRQSNVDLVAAQLKQSVQPGDFILVSPWYFGVSLQRYLDCARFATLPPVSELRIHRYDLMKKQMEAENPVGPLLDDIRETLQSGHALWVVGVFQTPPRGAPQPILPPYRGGMDMADSRYFSSWLFQVSGLIQAHAISGGPVPVDVPGGQPVNPVEDVALLVIRGWRH
jgi:4-amino-4-deoxy-L-arabinose transferase-like glycosyltransferase